MATKVVLHRSGSSVQSSGRTWKIPSDPILGQNVSPGEPPGEPLKLWGFLGDLLGIDSDRFEIM